jgi:hypothetical protein
MRRRLRGRGMSLETGAEGDQRYPAGEGAVWTVVVVVAAEGVELELQVGE